MIKKLIILCVTILGAIGQTTVARAWDVSITLSSDASVRATATPTGCKKSESGVFINCAASPKMLGVKQIAAGKAARFSVPNGLGKVCFYDAVKKRKLGCAMRKGDSLVSVKY